MREVPVGFVWL